MEEADKNIPGGYPKFVKEGWNENYLPVWLQAAGYSTFYTGKLMNGLTTSTWTAPSPRGWTGNECKSSEPPSFLTSTIELTLVPVFLDRKQLFGVSFFLNSAGLSPMILRYSLVLSFLTQDAPAQNSQTLHKGELLTQADGS